MLLQSKKISSVVDHIVTASEEGIGRYVCAAVVLCFAWETFCNLVHFYGAYIGTQLFMRPNSENSFEFYVIFQFIPVNIETKTILVCVSAMLSSHRCVAAPCFLLVLVFIVGKGFKRVLTDLKIIETAGEFHDPKKNAAAVGCVAQRFRRNSLLMIRINETFASLIFFSSIVDFTFVVFVFAWILRLPVEKDASEPNNLYELRKAMHNLSEIPRFVLTGTAAFSIIIRLGVFVGYQEQVSRTDTKTLLTGVAGLGLEDISKSQIGRE